MNNISCLLHVKLYTDCIIWLSWRYKNDLGSYNSFNYIHFLYNCLILWFLYIFTRTVTTSNTPNTPIFLKWTMPIKAIGKDLLQNTGVEAQVRQISP